MTMKMEALFTELNDKHANQLLYLRERWEDESAYEDINDYLKAIRKMIPSAFEINGHPFSFKCRCEDGELTVRMPIRDDKILVQGFCDYTQPELQEEIMPEDEPQIGGA